MTRPEIGATGVGNRSRHDRPVIKEPVWAWEIPFYFFTGGLAGASAALAFAAGVAGDEDTARRAWTAAFAGVALSPLFLISDLGRPARFFNMLRVFKVTSPMSVGSWLLAGAGPTIAGATLHARTGRFARLGSLCRPPAVALGLPLTTYTAALIANTAVPAWHEARHDLPFVFGASSVASAGAVATMAAPAGDVAAVRAMAVAGALAEAGLSQAMEHRLGPLRQAYSTGVAGRFGKLAKGLSIGGAGVLAAAGGRSRAARLAGGAMVSGGALAMRWSVFKAGSQSAADPDQTVQPQRERIERGRVRGAVRRGA